jgi:hypothetical protein
LRHGRSGLISSWRWSRGPWHFSLFACFSREFLLCLWPITFSREWFEIYDVICGVCWQIGLWHHHDWWWRAIMFDDDPILILTYVHNKSTHFMSSVIIKTTWNRKTYLLYGRVCHSLQCWHWWPVPEEQGLCTKNEKSVLLQKQIEHFTSFKLSTPIVLKK